MKFAVVEFVGTNAIDYVPDVWLKGNEETYWPGDALGNVSKLRTRFTKPDDSWNLFPIEILTYASKYKTPEMKSDRIILSG